MNTESKIATECKTIEEKQVSLKSLRSDFNEAGNSLSIMMRSKCFKEEHPHCQNNPGAAFVCAHFIRQLSRSSPKPVTLFGFRLFLHQLVVKLRRWAQYSRVGQIPSWKTSLSAEWIKLKRQSCAHLIIRWCRCQTAQDVAEFIHQFRRYTLHLL